MQNQQQQQIAQAGNVERVSSKEFAAKYKSKREVCK